MLNSFSGQHHHPECGISPTFAVKSLANRIGKL